MIFSNYSFYFNSYLSNYFNKTKFISLCFNNKNRKNHTYFRNLHTSNYLRNANLTTNKSYFNNIRHSKIEKSSNYYKFSKIQNLSSIKNYSGFHSLHNVYYSKYQQLSKNYNIQDNTNNAQESINNYKHVLSSISYVQLSEFITKLQKFNNVGYKINSIDSKYYKSNMHSNGINNFNKFNTFTNYDRVTNTYTNTTRYLHASSIKQLNLPKSKACINVNNKHSENVKNYYKTLNSNYEKLTKLGTFQTMAYKFSHYSTSDYENIIFNKNTSKNQLCSIINLEKFKLSAFDKFIENTYSLYKNNQSILQNNKINIPNSNNHIVNLMELNSYLSKNVSMNEIFNHNFKVKENTINSTNSTNYSNDTNNYVDSINNTCTSKQNVDNNSQIKDFSLITSQLDFDLLYNNIKALIFEDLLFRCSGYL